MGESTEEKREKILKLVKHLDPIEISGLYKRLTGITAKKDTLVDDLEKVMGSGNISTAIKCIDSAFRLNFKLTDIPPMTKEILMSADLDPRVRGNQKFLASVMRLSGFKQSNRQDKETGKSIRVWIPIKSLRPIGDNRRQMHLYSKNEFIEIFKNNTKLVDKDIEQYL